VELLLPLGGLALLFAGFVAVQFRFLFAGDPPKGMTFSNYAVQGFGQLVVVTLLTLLIIACASRWSPRETPSDRSTLRGILGVLVALSLVVVASAVYRMWLYMNELGWTRERLFFGAVELFLGFVFLLVLLAGIKLRAAWFTRAVIASFAVLLVAIAAINPERYIARQNIERFERLRDTPGYMKTFDLGYLQWLTSDAIDELVKMDEPYRSCALRKIEEICVPSPTSGTRGTCPGGMPARSWPARSTTRTGARSGSGSATTHDPDDSSVRAPDHRINGGIRGVQAV
jgi:uncharacterized membrane protein YidH (DUF202 family)